MADLVVRYNGITITPTPLVSYSTQFIDYGSRWGNVAQIELNGIVTGLPSGGTGILNTFTSIFTGQFGTLDVIETGVSTLYAWSNVVVEEISFSNNGFHEGTIAPYSAKMKSYNVPSGVVEPVNEYSFAEGDDGITTVTHKISAKGIKNFSGAFANAIGFVRNFTGRNTFAPAFIPNGTGVLASLSEVIDRSAASYAITETYKYNSGLNQPYIETFTVGITDVSDNDYLSLDVNWRVQGSPVNNNLSTIEPIISTGDLFSKISSLGISTGFLVKNSSTINRDTGAAVVEIRSTYISGYSNQELSGFFDYTVSIDNDKTVPREVWKVDGEFFCKGPLHYNRQRVATFKSANQNDWRGYLSGLITSSPLFTTYHNAANGMSSQTQVQLQENTGAATFKLSMTMNEGGDRLGSNQKYSIDVQPSKWNFDLLPSANIEGHYVVQDLQMRSRAEIQITLGAESLAPVTLVNTISGIMDELSAIYVVSGFIVGETLTTGISNIEYVKRWKGLDNNSNTFLFSKVVGATSYDYVRPPNFKFGF